MTKVMLVISLAMLIIVFYAVRQIRKNSNMHKYLYWLFIVLIVQISGMICQAFLSQPFDIEPIKFEYIGYIGSFIAPFFMLFSIEYLGKQINSKWEKVSLIIPCISVLMIWTNDYHQLFYKQYSTEFSEQITGSWFLVHSIYSYICIAIAIYAVIRATLKKSGFFSLQTLFIILGCLFPLVPNMLATFGIISMTVYVTPMLFAGTAICFYIAIIKLKALNVIPVATKTIMETMTDSFIVISKDGTIADINRTCIEKFAPLMELKQNDNLYEKLEGRKTVKLSDIKAIVKEANDKKSTVTKEYHFVKGDYDKYFEVDVQPIKAKSGNEFVATLLLIRDITQAKRDMEIMTKNENLVILGELAGGVAHDINTPIAAIKNGIMMLKDTVPTENEKMLLTRMDSCADKIINLVNSMRNQIRNIGSDEKTQVNISAVINDTLMIVHNETMKKGIKINVDIKDELTVLGNSTKLGQVITNLVMNAIQAYEDKQGIIDIDLYKSDKNEAVIIVEDYAGGIPEHIRPHIFKNILTTKGVSGTGFGLYLAYSVIKGNFGGDMKFETETGKGTKFYITIPL